MNKNSRSVRRKKLNKRRIAKLILFSLFILLLIGSFYVYRFFATMQDTHSELERGEYSKLREENVSLMKEPISIALFGIEDYSSGGANGRTDTIIVLTLNPDDKTIKMLSIPRDSRVEIVGRGEYDKINHAFAFGGPDMAIDTLENLLDIPIDYYATINFEAFVEIVNELGGVTVDVPFNFSEVIAGTGERVYFAEGKDTLTGEEALAYVRMRKYDPRGDLGRIDRQKQVISAAIDSASPQKILLELDDILNHIGENVTTSLKTKDMISLLRTYSDVGSSKIESVNLNGADSNIEGIYYYEIDQESLDEVIVELKEHLDIN
ncbi:LCP family protein [Sutcliffiella halmapala]